jgi:hypothetical protein
MSDLVFNAGNCTVEIKKYCDQVKPGAARWADCVQGQVEAEESGTTSADEGALPGCWWNHPVVPQLLVHCRHSQQQLQGRAVGLQGDARHQHQPEHQPRYAWWQK